jgi:hypothetical protein
MIIVIDFYFRGLYASQESPLTLQELDNFIVIDYNEYKDDGEMIL